MINDLPSILIASATILGVFGAGIKWLTKEFKSSIAASEKVAEEARKDLAKSVNNEILGVRTELADVKITLGASQKLNSLYLRRIYQLESAIHSQPGMPIPTMEGWPPQ